MATTRDVLRRTLLTSAFMGAAVIAPMLVTPAPASAQCQSGEEHDVFTTTCVPFLTPRSPITTTGANPDVPEVDGIPCVGGRSSAACYGLLEDAQAAGPPAIPRTTISASP